MQGIRAKVGSGPEPTSEPVGRQAVQIGQARPRARCRGGIGPTGEPRGWSRRMPETTAGRDGLVPTL